MRALPSVAEERWMAVRELVPKSAFVEERCGGWRASSLLARCGFFLLSALCVGALFGLVAVLSESGRGAAIFTGIASLVTAEYLILRFRFFAAGLEEALWLGGAVALAGGIFWGADHAVIAFVALAVLGAGVRLLNPLFATAAPIVFAFYVVELATPMGAALFCAALAAAALIFVPFRRRRPSVDRAAGAATVVLPFAAYVFAKEFAWEHFSWRVAALLLIYAVAALLVGLRFRLHAPLLALFPTLGALAYELRDVSGLTLEARLLVWGGLTLAVSIAVERFLRRPRRGLTSVQMRDDRITELLQLAGTAAITPHAQPAPEQPRLHTGGGAFGGAGASGDV